jgi:hypothetical protein
MALLLPRVNIEYNDDQAIKINNHDFHQQNGSKYIISYDDETFILYIYKPHINAWWGIEYIENVYLHVDINQQTLDEYTNYVIANLNLNNGNYDARHPDIDIY